MKKKFLSLMMAAAVVASTSVSAFAATYNEVTTDEVTIESGDKEKEVQIGIEGNILNNDGNKVPGTISVTVPTATTFSVNAADGTLTSPEMTITNRGDERIKVTASKFEDANGSQKINIIKETEFGNSPAQQDRGTVWLKLTGDSKNLGLTSEENGKMYGKMYDNNYENPQQDSDNYEIGKVNAKGGTMKLKLEGKGGTRVSDTKPSSEAIQDNFKLVLKISRDRQS